MKEYIKESELILNNDGSVYHLHLKPEDIADTIIIVGDPDRVATVSKHFDTIQLKRQNREIHTHTGYYKNKRITVLSTGMGPDNIDIVINELDALANIDLDKRQKKAEHKSLNIIRLGTSGALQNEIKPGAFIASKYGLGIDGLLNFYAGDKKNFNNDLSEAFEKHCNWDKTLAKPYASPCSEELLNKLGEGLTTGITLTAPGFYGPQGRVLRLKLANPDINKKIESFHFNGMKITNMEMETSALYGLGNLLGHNTLTICVAIANRVSKKFINDYKQNVEALIKDVLDKL
ncbi:MAG: nucleoside phosphorylase [Bacteroidales bacterium]|nr:nucleoside phosphorylase [Bacteroidales bacterium]